MCPVVQHLFFSGVHEGFFPNPSLFVHLALIKESATDSSDGRRPPGMGRISCRPWEWLEARKKMQNRMLFGTPVD